MGFVHDHGEAFIFGGDCDAVFAFIPQFLQGLGDEGEFLQGRDDDRRAVGQRLHELAGILVDFANHALLVLELVNGVLELLIEDAAVGDDDDRVEDFFVGLVVQTRKTVR